MANAGRTPGEPDSAPIESRRAPPAGAGAVTQDEETVAEGESSVLDVPQMGEFSAEAARPTPLDDLVETERRKLPKD